MGSIGVSIATVPARVQKAGVRDYWVYATNLGAPGGEFTLVTPIAKGA